MKEKVLVNGIVLLYAVAVVTSFGLIAVSKIHTLLFAVGLTLYAITSIFDVIVKHFSSDPDKRKSLYVKGACLLISTLFAYLVLLDIAWITKTCEVFYLISFISLAIEGYYLIKEERERGLFNF